MINTFDLDYVLPVSLVDENMKRAHNRDGLLATKFWWKVPAGQEPSTTGIATLQESQFVRSRPQQERQQATEGENEEEAESTTPEQE